ncbi:MAG: hypothetical protein R3E32_27395 [Chitinophagales bacterium]
MIFKKKSTDEILLQDNPNRLVEKYEKVVLQLVHQFWQKVGVSDSELEIIETIVFQRLPLRLAKYQDKAEGKTYALTLLVECTQVICSDILDLQLLRQQSPQLIVKYIPYISARLDYLVNTDFIKMQDAEDVLQWVQQKLIERLQNGQLQQFESKQETLFRTYLYRVVQNLFTDIHRSLYQTQKNRNSLELKASLIENKSNNVNPFDQLSDDLSLSLQLKRLQQLLQLFSATNRLKFELCLKTSYQLILYHSDVKNLQLTTKTETKMLAFFGADYTHESSGNVWRTLNEYLDIWENKQGNPDTLRKWFTRQRNQIIAKLLLLTVIDRGVNDKKSTEQFYKNLLQKINKDRNVAKYAYEWFGERVYVFYHN